MLIRISKLLSAADLGRIRHALETAQFAEGTMTGKKSLKRNLQAVQSSPGINDATKTIVGALMRRREFTSYVIPKQVFMMFNRYDVGMEYKDHMDAALMGGGERPMLRSDVSVTVFLTDPGSYQGGEFVLQSPFGEMRIKEPAGHAIAYPSNMLHRVDPITEGSRWACVGWAQSLVQDTSQRLIIHELDQLRYSLTAELPDSPYPEKLARTYQNLLRMWAEV
jgi:PKHD-type hydroxylase